MNPISADMRDIPAQAMLNIAAYGRNQHGTMGEYRPGRGRRTVSDTSHGADKVSP